MQPKILIVAAGIATDSPDLAGGDMRFLEIARNWIKKGYEVHILTPKGGEHLCKKFNVPAKVHLLPKSKWDGRFQAIYDTLLLPFRLPKSIFEVPFDALYSVNEQLYDVIPALFVKRKLGSRTRWGVVVHWLPPFPPWKRHRSTVLNSCLFFFSERLSVWLAGKYADVLLPVSEATKTQLLDVKINPQMIQAVKCGVPLDAVREVSSQSHSKRYDAVFMKRVQAVKGALDLPAIWREVLKSIPEAKLLVIGFGEDFDQLKRMVQDQGLEKSIELKGLVYDLKEKFSLLCQSRIFVLPSYEENWAIVIGEAMGANLPVVAYDLKELGVVWEDNFAAVPVGDTRAFAKTVVGLLKDSDERMTLAEKGRRYVDTLDWPVIAKEEFRALLPNSQVQESAGELVNYGDRR